jgi:hypothetical protein
MFDVDAGLRHDLKSSRWRVDMLPVAGSKVVARLNHSGWTGHTLVSDAAMPIRLRTADALNAVIEAVSVEQYITPFLRAFGDYLELRRVWRVVFQCQVWVVII